MLLLKMGDAELEGGREVCEGSSPSLAQEVHPTALVADDVEQFGAATSQLQNKLGGQRRPRGPKEAPELTARAAPLSGLAHPILLMRASVGEGLQPAEGVLHRNASVLKSSTSFSLHRDTPHSTPQMLPPA